MRTIFLLILSLCTSVSHAKIKVRIGVLSDLHLRSVWLGVADGNYSVFSQGQLVLELKKGQSAHLLFENDSIQVKAADQLVGKFPSLTLESKETWSAIKIKPLVPAATERTYDDDIEVSATGSHMRVINNVNIEKYVAGVVEAENGIKQNFEYYKLKSIICRTYALSNYRRHEAHGYQLCDKVHCQVYFGKSKGNDDIMMATMSTTGMVIVDSDLKLITAAFHSNCGGQTLNSEDVWSLSTSYLKSVKDTFCLHQPHATWEKKVPVNEWHSLLKHYHYKPDSLHQDCFVNFDQQVRCSEFTTHDVRIPLKAIRQQLNLNSTYFSIYPEDDQLKFTGRGYGHGLGLCQEGAMKMALSGMKYDEILHYYYRNIHLVDLSVLDFFRQTN